MIIGMNMGIVLDQRMSNVMISDMIVRGCVGVWVCGCVGVWVRGCVDVFHIRFSTIPTFPMIME